MTREDIVMESNKMIELLKETEPQKKNFHPILQKLDDAFWVDFREVKEPEDKIFFRYNEDERMQDIERKEKLLQSRPECCMFEAVKYCENKLHHFLEQYHIGFLHDFDLQESGMFYVDLACMITNMDSFHQESATKEIKAQLQLELLEKKGIQIHYNTKFNHHEISATTESIDSVLKLLREEMDAHILDMKLRDYKGFRSLNSISFYVDADILFEKDWTPIEVVLEKKEDVLNANEIGLFYHNLKELNSAVSYMEINKELSVSIIKSLFSEICKLTNYDGKIFQEIDGQRKPIRDKNILIHEKEAELGSMMKTVIKDAVKRFSAQMKKNIYEKLNFDMRKFTVTPHQVKVDFSFSTGPNFDKLKQLTDEELYSLYDTNNGTIDEEDMLVLCTERNQKTLENEISELYPGIVITDLDVKNHWSVRHNAIKGFTVSLDRI